MAWGRTVWAGCVGRAVIGLWFSLWLGTAPLDYGIAAEAFGEGSAFAVYGAPALPSTFSHFPYVDPHAAKGGALRRTTVSAFDTLNPFIVRGTPAMEAFDLLYESLLAANPDEQSVAYPWLASDFTVDETERKLHVTLQSQARWHDGKPITTADILATSELLSAHGRPFYRALLKSLTIEVVDERSFIVRLPTERPRDAAFAFATLPVLPAHYWATRDFSKTTVEAPLGSGPYSIASFEPGRSIALERMKEWWAADLPAMRGRYNFDRIETIVVRDPDSAQALFLRGEIDMWPERDARRRDEMRALASTARHPFRLIETKNWWISGMIGPAFNLRDHRFKDARVREALSVLYDHRWLNEALFAGTQTPITSYFQNSVLAAGDSISAEELAVLERVSPATRAALEAAINAAPRETFAKPRDRQRRALTLLADAGWRVENGVMKNAVSGESLSVRILAQSAAPQRLIGQWLDELTRIGVHANLEVVDSSIYAERMQTRDFEMLYAVIIPPEWPGIEQRRYWTSHDSNSPNGNLFGLVDPVADELVEQILATEDHASIIGFARWLDRRLRAHWLVVPTLTASETVEAVRNDICTGARQPRHGNGRDAWFRGDCRQDE
jgi:microcin C transport system substrate-binding protein